MNDRYVIALTTLPADAEASGIARTLVDERLAACVNILPAMTSVYRWKDGIEQDSEQQLLMKTSQTRVAALWERLRALHPYDVPEFVVIPVIDGNDAYLKWVGEAISPTPASDRRSGPEDLRSRQKS